MEYRVITVSKYATTIVALIFFILVFKTEHCYKAGKYQDLKDKDNLISDSRDSPNNQINATRNPPGVKH